MKQKISISLSVVVILLVGAILWFNAPLDLMDLDPGEVKEIVVFNGNNGNTTHITDKEQIQHIVDNLNDVEMERTKLSVGYTGYSFKVTIYLSDGNEADGWNNFIINSDDTIRKDPFFYFVTKGNIDYAYIETVESHISIPDFSYAEESAIYVEGKPGVKASGFVNTSETEITIENVAEYAENECTIEYDNVTTYFDPIECVWKVHFSTTGMLGGDQTIYMDRNGKTILVVYGE